MKKKLLMAAIITVMCTGAALGEGLVKNAGFEQAGADGQPLEWHGAPAVYSRDTAEKHSGDGALKYVNADSAAYVLCAQPVTLISGKMYEISAWVKTQDITGEESGATLCVEYSDSNGKWIGGCYPQGIKGTSDWTLVKGITGRIPPEAAHCTLSCYVRREMTGTAWWDDVSITPVAERPLSSMLMSPNYRNQVLGPDPEPVRVRCFTTLTDYDLQLSDVLFAWRVLNTADQSVVAQGELDPVPAAETDIVVDCKALKDGRYTLETTLQRKNGEALATDTWTVSRITEIPERKAYIDAHNRLILNGEPFFPLGMYWGAVTPEQLDIYAQSDFNCLMPYGAPSKEMMDEIHARGLKVIYTVKDLYHGTSGCPADIQTEEDEYARIKSYVEQFRDHPALMAWYNNDELPLDMLDRLSLHRQWIEELDPHHPAWVVLYQVDQVREYLPTYDVIGTDPYPIPHDSPSKAGVYARKMTDALCGSRAFWQVPQVFNWANYQKNEADKAAKRAPTFEEMRSMAWQSIAEGANGLVFYSWFDIRRDPATPFEEQWAKIKTIAREIREMTPVLLSVEPLPNVVVEPAPWLNVLVHHAAGVTRVVLVNNCQDTGTARVLMPAGPASIADRAGGRPVPLAGDGVTAVVEMQPLDVRILEVHWKP